MASVLLSNAPEGHTPPDVPYKEDGSFYEYFMNYEGGRYLAYADSPAELLEYLIPGYLDKDEDEQILSRITLALNVQAQAQGLILAGLDNETYSGIKEWEMKVLTHAETSSPHDWGKEAGEFVEPESGESIDIWHSRVPLILVDTGYAPFTDVPRPISALGASKQEDNLYWIEPSDEEEFLYSLSSLNYIYIARRLNS